MRKIDTSAYSVQAPKTRVKPEKVNLGDLPPIQKHKQRKKATHNTQQMDKHQQHEPRVSQDVVQKVKAIEEGQTRYDEAILKAVSKEVQAFGKNSCLYRLTDLEKSRLAQLTFQLKSEGYKVTETDIVRVALNYALEDDESSIAGGLIRRVAERLKR